MAKYLPLDEPVPSETERILDDSASDGLEPESGFQTRKKRRINSWFKNNRSVLLHSLLILGNLLLCLVYTAIFSSQALSRVRSLHSKPVRSIIEFEPRQFELSTIYLANGSLNTNKPNDFNGNPRPELDKAWQKLIGHQAFRVPKEELGQFSEEKKLIQLSDGSGYYVTLAVFHGLHCVKRLHHFIHHEIYYDGISETEFIRLKSHTEHCLDWLRQSIQCNSDTTLLPLYWDDSHPIPVSKDSGNHQCVKWGPLERWAESNSFDPFEPGLLVHPIFGHPYGENNEGDKIGIVEAGS